MIGKATGANSDDLSQATMAASQLSDVGASFLLPRIGIGPAFGTTMSRTVEAGDGAAVGAVSKQVDKGAAVVTKSAANFADKSKLAGHFEKHGAEFGAKSADEYLSIAQDVMKNGTKVQYPYKGETRTGYVQLMGNNRNGQSKFAFVGTNSQGQITTLHTKSGKDLWKTLNSNSADKTIYPAP